MNVAKSAVAGGASLVLLALAPAPPFDHEVEPPSYTFQMDVVMAMHHFPWLHFHMQGTGVYESGESYVVHFDELPWFASRQQHDCDLSMLDPLMWPKRFTYSQIGERGGNTLFALRSINDPTLKSATVALGPLGHTRQLDATYTDGTHIEMNVGSSEVGGFLLPATLTADIDEPHLALSANADFKDYDFSTAAIRPGASR